MPELEGPLGGAPNFSRLYIVMIAVRRADILTYFIPFVRVLASFVSTGYARNTETHRCYNYKEQTEYKFKSGQGINKDFILWSISFDKKLRRNIGSAVKCGMMLRFNTKSSVTLILALLLVAGDTCICPNPGPPKFPCGSCKKAVRSN